MIGAIGSKAIDDVIIFEVSDEKVLTFSDFTRNTGVRFATNDVLLRKPVSQYVGPSLEKVSFKIILRAKFGVNPKVEFDKLIKLQHDGTTLTVMLGSSLLGAHKWRIVDLGIPYENIDNKGICISSTVSISLEEYV
jgi:phage protein U